MSKANNRALSFRLKGKLTEIHPHNGQIKHIKLTTDNSSYWIKVGKKLRSKILGISCGSQVEIVGKSKQKRKKDKVKYKAQIITLISQAQVKNTVLPKEKFAFPSTLEAKAKVLVCHKSNCWRKGGKKVYQALDSVLRDRNLTEQISVKKTGCLKKCKQAPNLVMLPDKVHYKKVKPKQVESFVQQHLITKA